MFYGNGTARLVRDSAWRDQGAGVLPDLGSHLLDTARFWFGDLGDDFASSRRNRFENRAPDHVVIGSSGSQPQLELEMTLLIVAQPLHLRHARREGHARTSSRCASGGRRTFTHAHAACCPSGRPPEETVTLVAGRSDLGARVRALQALCARAAPTDLDNDLWLHRTLRGSRRDAHARRAA